MPRLQKSVYFFLDRAAQYCCLLILPCLASLTKKMRCLVPKSNAFCGGLPTGLPTTLQYFLSYHNDIKLELACCRIAVT